MAASSYPATGTRWKRAIGRGALGVAILGGALAVGAADDETKTRSMRRMFESLQQLLPLSVDPVTFADPTRAVEIRTHLETVARSAAAVATHTKGQDEGTRFLGRSLEQEARQARELFALGAIHTSRLGVLQMTEYCVACHSRLPAAADPPFSASFLADDVLAQLEPASRADVQLATRQFDAALATLEGLLREPGSPSFELLEQVTSYLVISLHVKRDFERPIPVLRALAARPDVWTHLKLDVKSWITALEELAPRARTSNDLDEAIALLNEGRQRIRFPSDRQAVVHYVAAAGILERFLASDSAPDSERARAYYLLAVTESRLGTSYWMSLPSFYLETSIRLDPSGDSALPAYAMLEEITMCDYSLDCSAEVGDLPAEIEQYLGELEALVAGGRGPLEGT